MVGQAFLDATRAGTLLVNTSRGRVTEAAALYRWLKSGRGHAALDVWPNEPGVDIGLLARTSVGTPHVAGYSLDGKLRGTQMIYDEFCSWLGVAPTTRDLLSGLTRDATLGKRDLDPDDAVLRACPVERDDAALRSLAADTADNRAMHFDKLRREYPERRDFAGWRIPADAPQAAADALRSLGFSGSPHRVVVADRMNPGELE